MDARLQEAFPIPERYKAIVAVEVFNMMDHFNRYSYTINANNVAYGQPSTAHGSGYLEYASWQLQFLARFTF